MRNDLISQRVVDAIDNAILTLGKDQRISIIFNANKEILYFDTTTDVTDDVLNVLNK